ncbi:MAG: sigma-54-dependent Fis family transcriptional regulator [Betaproteobacteria bacterium]|nr:sigma-54-dependent Fis family transcriptional regulator [Betaproteobacteria bacterium]
MSTASRPRLCLVEDDEIAGDALADRFDLEGFDCSWFRTGRESLLALQHRRFDLVVSDIRLPDMSGETLFAKVLEDLAPVPPYVFITGYGEIDQAVRLLKLGATDYITKPFDIETLLEKIRALAGASLSPAGDGGLGVSPAMLALEAMLARLRESDSHVLITGESGVGKEKVAFALHRQRHRRGTEPFIAVNCGALTESLLETELFGHEAGAFTGAARLRRGVFEQAAGGTLFLDEIGDMPLATQVRLLRVIEERRVTRVGGETPVPLSLHIICATHQDLGKMVESGKFREDLYYRINVVNLHVPPLRERREDIPWLARRFLEEEAAQRRAPTRQLSASAERAMMDHSWPGNVRELKHTIERACLFSTSRAPLQPEDLFPETLSAIRTADGTLSEHLESMERQYIVRVLAAHNGRIGRAAGALGISRKGLWEKMKRLGISAKRQKLTS